MQQQSRTEAWQALCEKASTEDDGERLLEIVQQLNKTLDEEHAETRKKAAA